LRAGGRPGAGHPADHIERHKKGAWIDLSIYRNLPQLPLSAAKTYELNTGNDASATRCRGKGHCVAADSGDLTLTRLDGTGGAGSYKFHLKDGTAEEGDFPAALDRGQDGLRLESYSRDAAYRVSGSA